jgi:hypothetical protein
MIFGYALTAVVGVPPRGIGVNYIKFLGGDSLPPFLNFGPS